MHETTKARRLLRLQVFVLLLSWAPWLIGGSAIGIGGGSGITAADRAFLDLWTVGANQVDLASTHALKIDSTRKLLASIVQANPGGSLDIRNHAGSSAVNVATSGDTTFYQNIVGTHGKALLVGSSGDGLIFDVSGPNGTFLFAVDGSAVSNYALIPSGTVRTGDVRSGSYYDLTGAGPAIFYSGAIIYPSALPVSPATGQLACDSGASNVIKSWDGSSWLAH